MTRSSLLGSWIDVEAAAAAAETLCHPLPHDPGLSVFADPAGAAVEQEEEEANDVPPRFLRGRLSALRARAERNGLVPAAPPAGPAAPPFAVPLGSLPVRVRALADWLNESFAPEALFVADDQGHALVEFRGGDQLLAAAAVLAEAAARARRHLPGAGGGAMVHLTLGPGQVLSLVSVPTVMGPWHAGLTTALPLSETDALDIARHLQSAAAGV